MFKLLIAYKPLGIRFHTIDGLTRISDGTRSLILFGDGKDYFIYKKIMYLIGTKSGIKCILFLLIMQKPKLINTIICL